MSPEESRRVRRLFWNVFFVDKSLVLSLGRAPAIQDFDVDVEFMEPSEDPGKRPWDAALFLFIQLAKIQAHAYETLYSPASDKRSARDRQVIVDTLAKRMAKWHESWSQLDGSQAHRKEMLDNTLGGLVDVVYYSTLTLVYRALSPPKTTDAIVEPCFDSARSSLRAHISLHARYAELGPEPLAYYSVWVHIFSSFTPFLVTFHHCITELDLDDLKLLKASLDVLEQTKGLVSSCQRVFDYCSRLYGIAETACTASPPGDSSAFRVDDQELLFPFAQALEEPWVVTEPDYHHVSLY